MTEASFEPLLLSVVDAGKSLGIGRSSVYKLIYKRKLSTVKVGGRRLVKVESIRAFVETLG